MAKEMTPNQVLLRECIEQGCKENGGYADVSSYFEHFAAAEILKKVMLKVHETLKDKDDIALLLQVHDELIFDVNKDIEEKLLERVDTAISKGYKIISLADPLSSVEFLGKKGTKVYIDTILPELIYKLKNLCESNDCILHLCPRLSVLLKSDENIKFKEVKLEGSYNSLVEALLSNHKESITAFRCIHFRGKIDKIKAVRLD